MFDRERIIQIFFFAFLALMAYELFVLLAPFLTPIAWAILIAFVMHPLLVELDRVVKRRSLSALILTLGVALGIILPAVWLSGRLASEAQNLYAYASAAIGNNSIGHATEWMRHSEWVMSVDRRLGYRIKVEDVTRFEQGLLLEIRDKGKDILAAIRDKREITDETEGKLKAFVDQYAKNFG